MLIAQLTRVNLVEAKESEKSQPVLLDQEMPVETEVNFGWKFIEITLSDDTKESTIDGPNPSAFVYLMNRIKRYDR